MAGALDLDRRNGPVLQSGPREEIVRLDATATRAVMDNLDAKSACYLLITDDGQLRSISTDWAWACKTAETMNWTIYNPRSCKATKVHGPEFKPVRLFMYAPVFDYHHNRGRRITYDHQVTWHD